MERKEETGKLVELASAAFDYIADTLGDKGISTTPTARWIGGLCTAGGMAGFRLEAPLDDKDMMDVLDGVLGYCEILAQLEDLSMASVDGGRTRKVFVFDDKLITKEALQQSRYYTYGTFDQEALKKLEAGVPGASKLIS